MSGSIKRRPDGRWRARWREYPGAPEKARHFDRKVDAERWLVETQHSIHTGTYVDPAKAKVTVADYAEGWLSRMAPTWRASTALSVANRLNRHVLPVVGRRPLASVRRSDVEALCAGLPLAPSTVGVVHQHIVQLLAAAVED